MKLRTRVWRRLLGVTDRTPSRQIYVTDLKVNMHVRLLGQTYEVVSIYRTWANERDVTLREVGGPNRLALRGLEFPFAVFELVDHGTQVAPRTPGGKR